MVYVVKRGLSLVILSEGAYCFVLCVLYMMGIKCYFDLWEVRKRSQVCAKVY